MHARKRRHRHTQGVRYEGRNFDGTHGRFEERTHRYDDFNCHNPNQHVWPNIGWERSAQFDSTLTFEAYEHRGFGMDAYNTRSSDDGFSYAGQALCSRGDPADK